jgi:DNA-binding PadR family transcriptional regulator
MARRSDWPSLLTPAAIHILVAIADEPRHGLAIADEIARRTRGHVRIGPGSLYGTIRRLRESSLIVDASPPTEATDDDPRRRYYAITAAGRRALARELQQMDRLVRAASAKGALRTEEV